MIKINLLRGATIHGTVLEKGATSAKVLVDKVENGLPKGDWENGDIITIPYDVVKRPEPKIETAA